MLVMGVCFIVFLVVLAILNTPSSNVPIGYTETLIELLKNLDERIKALEEKVK